MINVSMNFTRFSQIYNSLTFNAILTIILKGNALINNK